MIILAGTPIGNLGDASSRLIDTLRGAEAMSPEAALARVEELVESGTRLKHAVAEVAEATGLSKRELYEAALRNRDR